MAPIHHMPTAQRAIAPGLFWRPVTLLAMAAGMLALASSPGWSQSQILQSVKNNPGKAKQLCGQLRQMNDQGISYTSRKATRQIAKQEGLSPGDAEVLTTYVVGLHCPDVR